MLLPRGIDTVERHARRANRACVEMPSRIETLPEEFQHATGDDAPIANLVGQATRDPRPVPAAS
jgi:hypothetical protein